LPRRERTLDLRNSHVLVPVPVPVPIRVTESPVPPPFWDGDEKENSDFDNGSQKALTPSSSESRISSPSLGTPLTEDGALPPESSLMVYKRKGYFEAPQTFGGGVLTAINALNGTPIPETSRNVELYHFCKIIFTIHFYSHLLTNLLQFTTT
jgi:hypothetical protein